jgi:hypothetical protein
MSDKERYIDNQSVILLMYPSKKITVSACILVPTLCVGMHARTLCVQSFVTQSVKAVRSHAERGNEKKSEE